MGSKRAKKQLSNNKKRQKRLSKEYQIPKFLPLSPLYFGF